MFKLILKLSPNNLLIIEGNYFIGNKIFFAAKSIRGLDDIYLTESLQEAIYFIEKKDIKLIVLDLKLPDGNGLELLKKLKEKQLETKIFVFSISTELKQICIKYGATAFYDKAKDFENLIEAIEKA